MASLQQKIANILRIPGRTHGDVGEAAKDFCSKLQDAQRDSLGRITEVDELRTMLRKIAKEIHFPMSRLFPGKADRGTSRKAPPVRLDISDVSFIPGTFFFEEAKVQGPFDISQRGLYTEPPAGLDDILASGRPLAAFELGLLSLDPPSASSQLPATNMRCPAKDAAGHTLILQGWILQLGGKQVKMSQATNHEVPCQPSGVVCITTFRTDWDAPVPDWSFLVAAPAKTIIELLGTSSQDILEVWGRVWNGTHPGGRSAPAVADSFRIHLRVAEASLVALLGKSGTTNPAVFIDAFKDKETGLLPKAIPPFRIVWLPKEVGVTKAVAFHHKHIGLAESELRRLPSQKFGLLSILGSPVRTSCRLHISGGFSEPHRRRVQTRFSEKLVRHATELSEFTWAFNGQTVVADP